ncbi:MAG: helix-turn-helix domain-containing protein [Clostridiales bacterium]
MEEKKELSSEFLEEYQCKNPTYNDNNIIDCNINKIVSLFPLADLGILYLFDDRSRKLMVKSVCGFAKTYIDKLSTELDDSFNGKVYRSGKPLIGNGEQECHQLLDHTNLKLLFEDLLQAYPYSLLSIPVMSENKMVGVFAMANYQTPLGNFTDADCEMLAKYLSKLPLVLSQNPPQRKQSEGKITVAPCHWMSIAQKMEFNKNGYYGIILIGYSSYNNLFCQTELCVNKCINMIKDCLNHQYLKGFVVKEKNRICILLYFKNCKEGKNKVASFVTKISSSDEKLRIGVGSVYHSLTKSQKSYEEAQHCLGLLYSYPIPNKILNYAEMGIFRILSSDKEKTYNYIRNVLLPVLSYDKKKKNELWPTLQLYVKSNRAIHVVAKEMHVHINTVYCRIKKVQELLDIDFNNPSSWFEIQVVCNLVETLNLSFYDLINKFSVNNCCDKWD